VPPTIPFSFGTERGSLQLFLAKYSIDRPQNEGLIRFEHAKESLFDYLINNSDRHLMNELWGHNRIISIDHGASFRSPYAGNYFKGLDIRLPEIKRVYLTTPAGQEMLQRLRNLKRGTLKEELGSYLKESEIEDILKRINTLFRELNK